MTFARSAASFSMLVAMRSRASSRKPPVSPARIMAIVSSGKTLSCLAIAAESDRPDSMSARISPIVDLSFWFSVCSSRMARERSSDRPEAFIVANCRMKTDSSFSLTRSPSPGILISVCRPVPVCAIDSGIEPCWRSACTAACSFAASTLPFSRSPLALTTSYWNCLVAGMSEPSCKSLEVLGRVTELETLLVADELFPHPHREVLVEGEHAFRAARLHERGDLVVLALRG